LLAENIDDFQLSGRAWKPDREELGTLLSRSKHASTKPIYYGSNHTFLVELDGGNAGRSLAVYKPARGEYPLFDFPAGTLFQREVATYLVDRILGWNVVPPTVAGHGQFGIGSVQLFIETVAEATVEVTRLQRIALLDIVINNADRKAEHCLPGLDENVWGIDHGLTFHAAPKLRTVLWHFAGTAIPTREHSDLRRLLRCLQNRSPDAKALEPLLTAQELAALIQRAGRLVDAACFPDPRYRAVPYRW
jgi:hypothetical protein